MSDAAAVDITIIGGGVMGLWTLALAKSAGLAAVLIEKHALGAGQTIASQGILHAGVKYETARKEPGESTPLMQRAVEVWSKALQGRGPVDLHDTPVHSDRTHFWTTGSLVSGVAAAGAAAMLRSDVRPLDRADFPLVFRDAPPGVRVYEADERVIDTAAMLESLRQAAHSPTLKADTLDISPNATSVRLSCNNAHALIETRAIVLTAGDGNEDLLEELGPAFGPADAMQRRPLHMVMASNIPAVLHGHCIAASTLPRLTITTAPADNVWYIGGAPAEHGVRLSRDAQIEHAKKELAACLPWLDLSPLRWSTLRIDRAEASTPGGKRPTGYAIRRFGPVRAVWPTKLVLAPLAAEALLADLALSPRQDADLTPLEQWPQPPVAPYPWQRSDLTWT